MREAHTRKHNATFHRMLSQKFLLSRSLYRTPYHNPLLISQVWVLAELFCFLFGFSIVRLIFDRKNKRNTKIEFKWHRYAPLHAQAHIMPTALDVCMLVRGKLCMPSQDSKKCHIKLYWFILRARKMYKYKRPLFHDRPAAYIVQVTAITDKMNAYNFVSTIVRRPSSDVRCETTIWRLKTIAKVVKCHIYEQEIVATILILADKWGSALNHCLAPDTSSRKERNREQKDGIHTSYIDYTHLAHTGGVYGTWREN